MASSLTSATEMSASMNCCCSSGPSGDTLIDSHLGSGVRLQEAPSAVLIACAEPHTMEHRALILSKEGTNVLKM